MEVRLYVVHLQLGFPFLRKKLEGIDRVRCTRCGYGLQKRVLLYRGHLGGGELRKAAAAAIDLTERRNNRVRPVNTRDTGDHHVSMQIDRGDVVTTGCPT